MIWQSNGNLDKSLHATDTITSVTEVIPSITEVLFPLVHSFSISFTVKSFFISNTVYLE